MFINDLKNWKRELMKIKNPAKCVISGGVHIF